MQRDHARLHRSLAVLGPPRRFELMLLLISGVERSVSQLARVVRLSQSCTTRHLQALEKAGLVKGTRDGKRVVFRPAPRDAAARGVIASLAGDAEEALLLAGIAAGAIPVASTADRDPLTESVAEEPRPRRARRTRSRPGPEERVWSAPSEASRPRMDEAFGAAHEPAFETVTPEGPHEGMESDKHSDLEVPQRRYSSDIEDFLL